ncbi:MAG: nucleoside deaminase [Saprospiraceae bacterium]|nr:nucleoside deaminase [Saprospiraceae bacterium]
MEHEHDAFLAQAIQLAQEGMSSNEGGPFGAIVVKDGQVVGRGNNRVTSSKDPTAHAEVVAIRDACARLNSFQLTDCVLYTSCEPCPMCLGAIYWARPKAVYFACTKDDAAAAGFDDSFIYQELDKTHTERKIPMFQGQREAALRVFTAWQSKIDRIDY